MRKNVIAASLVICAACFAWLQNSSAEKEPAAVDFRDFVCDGDFFTAKIPGTWPKSESITAGRQAREYGVDLKGPRNKDGAYSRISLTYYAADHRQFTMDKYIRLNSIPDSSMLILGKKYGPVCDVTVGGRKGKMFEIQTFDFIPPYAVKPKEVAVLEKAVVLPGKEGGFYVIEYHAPLDIAEANMKLFDEVLANFKPVE